MKKIQKTTRTRKIVRHHAKHLFVPHKGNQYRPHLSRLHGVTAVLVIAVALQLVYGFMTSGRVEVLARVSTVDVTQLVAETNQERQSNDLVPLAVNPKLNEAAQLKAQDMFRYNYWAHTSPRGVEPWKWLGDVGYSYSIAGENLAKNYPTAVATVDAWMASPSHRENILNDRYTEVGFAVAEGTLEGRPTTLVVAFYGAPAEQPTLAADSDDPILFVAPGIGQGGGGILGYIGSAIQSLSPATLGALLLIAVVSVVASVAHHYRHQLPKSWRKSWRVHHGMYTTIGLVGLALVMILATGGGSI